MNRKFYRMVLVLFALCWLFFGISALAGGPTRAGGALNVGLLSVGYLILPIGIAGLWSEKAWGLIVVALGGVLIIWKANALGLRGALPMGLLLFFVLWFGALRRLSISRQANAANRVGEAISDHE